MSFNVKQESLPERCAICHNTDCFDATKNYCSRCSNLSIAKAKNAIRSKQQKPQLSRMEKIIFAITFYLGSFLSLKPALYLVSFLSSKIKPYTGGKEIVPLYILIIGGGFIIGGILFMIGVQILIFFIKATNKYIKRRYFTSRDA